MVSPERTKLLIADDHPVVRSGLRGMLGSQPDFEVIAEAENGAAAVFLARRLRPDVVLMDLKMPEMDGVTAITRIKSERPETQILVLTTYETEADILRALEKGAAGFLLKDAAHEELFGAVRSIAEGKSPLAPGVAARLVERLRGDTTEILSVREIDILRLVAEGTSNKDIADGLWVSEATVKSHLNRIFDKLGANDRTSAVTAALKRGIIRLES